MIKKKKKKNTFIVPSDCFMYHQANYSKEVLTNESQYYSIFSIFMEF